MTRHIGIFLATILAVYMVTATAQAQATWIVDDDAPGDPGPGDPAVSDPEEDGSTAHPFDAFQEAIDAATTGDTVLARNGTYTGIGNRDLELSGKAITVRSMNGAAACRISPTSAGRGFYLHQGESRETVIEGLTIGIGSDSYGGGFLIEGSSPTIRDCVITDCRASIDGGGFCCRGEGSPLISGCTITSCDADSDGGGIFCGGSAAPIVTNCTIQQNEGMDDGSGIYCEEDSTPAIIDCLISQNGCFDDFARGGGICAKGNAVPLITGCTITGNHVGMWENCYGGGVYWSDSACPTLLNCTITDNTADGMGHGGGIYCYNRSGATPLVKNCVISDNFAGGSGGGIYCRDNTVFSNCLISGNEGIWNAGGVYINSSSPTITNCSIVENSTHNDTGGGIACSGSSPTITNCILWANDPDSGYFSSSTETITHSDIQGGYAGTGNLDADPLFVTGPQGDYCLSQLTAGQAADSPCLDAGDPTYPLVDGTTRTDEIKDGGVVDVGYHYPVEGTVDAFFNCSPGTGTLPFSSRMTVALFNRNPDTTRRIAARIAVDLANGQSIPSWRAGFSNVGSGEIYYTAWPQAIPALSALTGRNLFRLAVEDVTPAPYNQPPYLPAGDTAFDNCLVEGIAP